MIPLPFTAHLRHGPHVRHAGPAPRGFRCHGNPPSENSGASDKHALDRGPQHSHWPPTREPGRDPRRSPPRAGAARPPRHALDHPRLVRAYLLLRASTRPHEMFAPTCLLDQIRRNESGPVNEPQRRISGLPSSHHSGLCPASHDLLLAMSNARVASRIAVATFRNDRRSSVGSGVRSLRCARTRIDT